MWRCKSWTRAIGVLIFVAVLQLTVGCSDSRVADTIQNGSTRERLRAIENFKHQPTGRKSCAAILNSLADRNKNIRRASVIALRRYRFDSEAAAIAEAISECMLDEDRYVRYAAADTLLHWYTVDSLNSSLPKIALALQKHPDLLDREGFAFIVAGLHGKSAKDKEWALSVLAQILDSDGSVYRVRAMQLLRENTTLLRGHGHVVYSEVVPCLLSILGSRGEGEAFFSAILLVDLMKLQPSLFPAEQELSVRARIGALGATDAVRLLRQRLGMSE